MSKVRVSNGSPPLERVDARQADHTRPPVCRILFGSTDREFERDAKDQMREMEKASKERWNFDFAKNEPLSSGKYEWEEVDGKDLPGFYTRPHHVKRTISNVTGTVDHNGNHDYLLTTPSVENRQEDSETTETESDCRTALSTPRKRPSTEDQDLPCQSKRPNVQPTEADHCPDTTPSESDPKT